MKRTSLLFTLTLLTAGCSLFKAHHQSTSEYDNPFYSKYLTTNTALDRAIQRDIASLRANPDSATTHNELGQLLLQKGFPKDAETEFERAVDSDSHFYPAWYNLALMRSARGDNIGARIAFSRTLHYKPGHSNALFQLGLLEEKRGDIDAAVEHYAKAISINHALLDVKVNPRILDSKIIHLALIRAYPNEHTRESMYFQGTPSGYGVTPAPAKP